MKILSKHSHEKYKTLPIITELTYYNTLVLFQHNSWENRTKMKQFFVKNKVE